MQMRRVSQRRYDHSLHPAHAPTPPPASCQSKLTDSRIWVHVSEIKQFVNVM